MYHIRPLLYDRKKRRGDGGRVEGRVNGKQEEKRSVGGRKKGPCKSRHLPPSKQT